MKPVSTVLVRVRFAECDAQNVVFNARYGDYVDVAVSEYYREVTETLIAIANLL
jgi:acyl-CoA thioesterase FadM